MARCRLGTTLGDTTKFGYFSHVFGDFFAEKSGNPVRSSRAMHVRLSAAVSSELLLLTDVDSATRAAAVDRCSRWRRAPASLTSSVERLVDRTIVLFFGLQHLFDFSSAAEQNSPTSASTSLHHFRKYWSLPK